MTAPSDRVNVLAMPYELRFRVHRRNASHVYVLVYVGRVGDGGMGAQAGELSLRVDEWDEFAIRADRGDAFVEVPE